MHISVIENKKLIENFKHIIYMLEEKWEKCSQITIVLLP